MRRRPPWRSTGEGAITPRPTDLYAARKAALADEPTRLSLEIVEEGIIVDPHHRQHRLQIGDVIWDRSETGLAVAFKIEDGEIVLLTFRELFRS